MLVAAYEECVNAKSKFSFPYVAKIIENWHKIGFETLEDIAQQNKETSSSSPAYDLEKNEKMFYNKCNKKIFYVIVTFPNRRLVTFQSPLRTSESNSRL